MHDWRPLRGACQHGAPTAKSLRPLTPGNDDFLRSSCSALRFFTSSSLVRGRLVGFWHTAGFVLDICVHVLCSNSAPPRLRTAASPGERQNIPACGPRKAGKHADSVSRAHELQAGLQCKARTSGAHLLTLRWCIASKSYIVLQFGHRAGAPSLPASPQMRCQHHRHIA